MSGTEAELWELYHRAYAMPYGPGQLAILEQVITHADAQGLTDLGFAARIEATSSYVSVGEPTRALLSFVWCLAEFDRDPVTHGGSQDALLWQFRYALRTVTSTPEIPLERTYALLDDMQRRWTETGHSLHTVYSHRHRVSRHIGDFVAAQQYYLQWTAAPRDNLSDCAGCDPAEKAYWLALRGDDEQAITVGETVLSGWTCPKQPQRSLTALMVPYLRTGRLEQARNAHRRAYRLHRPHLADLEEIGEHIGFCARTGNEPRALEMVERHLGWLDRAPSPWAAMLFAAWSALALRRTQALSAGVLTVRRPAHDDRPAAAFGAADLAEQLAEQATQIAERFDRRNSTERVGTQVRQILSAEPLVEYLPLSPTAAGRAGTVPPSPSTLDAPAPTGPRSELDELVEGVADRTAHGDHAAAAQLRHRLAVAYRDADRLIDAAEVAEEALAYRLLVDQAGDGLSHSAHEARRLLAGIYERMNQPDEALAQVEAIADDCALIDDRAGTADSVEQAGHLLDRVNRDEEAAARFLTAAEAYAGLGRSLDELRNRRQHARSLFWADELERAVAALRAADALGERLADGRDPELEWERARLAFDGAEILWHVDELDGAEHRAAQAAEISARLGKPDAEADARQLRDRIVEQRDTGSET